MTSPLHVLLIDNFDSFSFNLVDELRKRGAIVQVWRNDISAERAMNIALALPAPRLLMLSPGPSSPAQAGCCVPLVRAAENRIPVFGVCLGHQAIVEALGGEVAYAGEVVHGKSARIEHENRGLFEGMPPAMYAARYHSLTATRIPEQLEVTARAGKLVMAVQHRSAPIAGVQFHPESVLTPQGGMMFEAVMRWARDWHENNCND